MRASDLTAAGRAALAELPVFGSVPEAVSQVGTLVGGALLPVCGTAPPPAGATVVPTAPPLGPNPSGTECRTT